MYFSVWQRSEIVCLFENQCWNETIAALTRADGCEIPRNSPASRSRASSERSAGSSRRKLAGD